MDDDAAEDPTGAAAEETMGITAAVDEDSVMVVAAAANAETTNEGAARGLRAHQRLGVHYSSRNCKTGGRERGILQDTLGG